MFVLICYLLLEGPKAGHLKSKSDFRKTLPLGNDSELRWGEVSTRDYRFPYRYLLKSHLVAPARHKVSVVYVCSVLSWNACVACGTRCRLFLLAPGHDLLVAIMCL